MKAKGYVTDGKWRVLRYSGRGFESRVAWEGDDEQDALVEFKKIERDLRRGTVQLIRPDGRTELIVNAGSKRTLL